MIGTTLSHYRIEEKIGAGGMGEVYRAEDIDLRRPAMLTVLPEVSVWNLARSLLIYRI